MAVATAAARPYARALWELARERGRTDTVLDELAPIVEAVVHDRELMEVLARPWIPAQVKRAVAAEVATRAGASPLVRDFLALVARQGRGAHLEAMVAVLRELVDQEHGRVRARVRTAVALTEDERNALRQRLARALAAHDGPGGGPVREVVLEESVDDTLLGGFVAEVGSMIVDGSLTGQLARIRSRLAHG